MADLFAKNSKGPFGRTLLVLVILFALWFAWTAIRWQLGDMLADLTPPTEPTAVAVAEMGVKMAPSDPLAYWLRASASEDGDVAVRGFEDAVHKAPFDYRWRVDLGRALDQNDEPEKAEAQFKHAIELAPAYAAPRWYLGNFYLRHDRVDEAMAELKKAADNNYSYRDQVFSLAWEYFDKDPSKLEELAGDRPNSIARLAYFLAGHGVGEGSLRNWNRLSDPEKSAHMNEARAIAAGLFEQRHFQEALELFQQLGKETNSKPEAVTNGNFEQNPGESVDSRFGWQISRADPKIEIALDSKIKHGGARSLRLTFKGYSKDELANVFQTIVVSPKREYRIRFWYRTENLSSQDGRDWRSSMRMTTS